MKGAFPWLVRWACCASTRDFCSALAALVVPVQNIIFLTIHYFNSFVPISQQAGQATVLGRLSLIMCLWSPSPSKMGRQPCWVACLLLCVSGFHSNFFLLRLRSGSGGRVEGEGTEGNAQKNFIQIHSP